MVEPQRDRAQAPPVPALTLLIRLDCGLCEAFASDLASWDQGRGRYQLEIVNVESSAALSTRYGLRIPVLLAGQREICALRFRPERVASALGLA